VVEKPVCEEESGPLPMVEESVCEEEGGHHNKQVQELAENKAEEVHVVPRKKNNVRKNF
jgi:hypothetical protein